MIDDDVAGSPERSYGSYMWYYADELRRCQFHVVEVMGPDETVELLFDSREKFDMIVLDVMMPQGEVFADDPAAQRGLRTGICLAGKIHDELPRIPIIILTNAAGEDISRSREDNPSVKRVIFKFDCTPSAFAREVEDVLRETEK